MEQSDGPIVLPCLVVGCLLRTQYRSTGVLALHNPETASFLQAHDLHAAFIEERVEVEHVDDSLGMNERLRTLVLRAERFFNGLHQT